MRQFAIGCVVIIGLLGSASHASAQTVASYTFKVFNQGASQPFQTTPLAVAAFTCGVTPKIVVSSTVNPKRIIIDDPADATKDCVYSDPGSGPLLSLPFGSQAYTATIAAVNAAGTSPDSAASASFTRPGAVASAPTGLRVGQ